MTDNVVEFPGVTINKIDADKVLKTALGKLDVVVMAAIEKETGDLVFFSNVSEASQILWLIENFRHRLLSDDE